LKQFIEWLNSPEFKEIFTSYAEDEYKTERLLIKISKIPEFLASLTIKMKYDIWESENALVTHANSHDLTTYVNLH